MKLPSYLTLGGVGTKIKPFTEHSTDINWKVTAPAGVVVQKTGPHSCTIWNPKLVALNYRNFLVSSEEGTALGHVLTILHYTDKTAYEKARNWAKSGKVVGDRPSLFFYVTTSYGVFDYEPLINYSDERQEIAVIERYANTKIDTFSFNSGLNLEAIDRYTIVSLSSDSLSRLLEVPYGYDHLKPISVGDTLGLVYWDGTITAGGNFLLIKNATIQTDADYLNYYHDGDYTKILDTAGTTMWFSGAPLQAVYHDGDWDYSTTATNELLPHLFHVI